MSLSLLQLLKSAREIVKVHITTSSTTRGATTRPRAGEAGVGDRRQIKDRRTPRRGQGRGLHPRLGASGLRREKEFVSGGSRPVVYSLT